MTIDDQTFWDDIEAYCGALSYVASESVTVHVSCRRPTFGVTVQRWGAQRHLVWQVDELAGVYHQVPEAADANGCGWPVGFEIPIGIDWEPGFYLITLTAHGAQRGRDVAHAGFVVRRSSTRASDDDPSGGPAKPTPRTLLLLGTNTWNAYNTWGGCSLYTGGHQVSFRRPFARGMLWRPGHDRDDRKARPVRWGETPDIDGYIFQNYRITHGYPSAIGSAGWFTHERRFVEWAETNGYRFDMAVSSDLDTVPDLLDPYDLVVLVGHDEYWSRRGRDAVDSHLQGGGNLASFSGNTMFWQVRLVGSAADGSAADGSTTNRSADHMVGYKYQAHTSDPVVADGRPAEMTGMWADPMVGRPEWSTLGAGSAHGLYHRFGQATPRGTGGFLITDPDHWMVAGTGLFYGDVVGADHGVVGYETLGCPLQFDHEQRLVAAPLAGQAPEVEIVGFTLSSNLGVGEYPASIAALNDQGDLEFIAERLFDGNRGRVRRGNAVMLTCRPFGSSGGQAVTVGTTDWVFGLGLDNHVSTITGNVLSQLGGD